MKKTKITFAIAAAAIATGCTSLKINKDGSGKYGAGFLQKSLSELEYTKDGDKVTLKLKGYKSDAQAVIQGLEIMKQAYTGQPVKP